MTDTTLPQTSVADPGRRTWLIATGAAGGVATVATAVPFVSTFTPSERARAAGGPVEVDISDIPPGGAKTVEWRAQPTYPRNPARAVRPDVFVAIGICTHLGCSPTSAPQGGNNPSLPADWPEGFFCPCHGSTFDRAGRVFKNKPAPTNLEIPPHRYAGDTRILIGDVAA